MPPGLGLRMSRDTNPRAGDAVLGGLTFNQGAEKTEAHVLDMKKLGRPFVPSAGEGHYRISLILEFPGATTTREIVEFTAVPAVLAITALAAGSVLVVSALTLVAVLLTAHGAPPA